MDMSMKHTIFIGDCRQALRTLPSSSVHLVVTSPPYNVGIEYGKWDDSIAFEEYLQFTKEWLRQCFRVLTDDGRICVNIPTSTYKSNAIDVFRLHETMKEIGFKNRELIIWVKKRESDGRFVTKQKIHGTWNPANPLLRNPAEAILVMNKHEDKLYGEMRSDLTTKEFLEWSYTVWEMDTEMDRTHPAPYPLELPRRLIKFYSFPGQTIVDPFLGSGTTMKACMELNRNSIGMELNPEYVEMIKARLECNIEIEHVEMKKDSNENDHKAAREYLSYPFMRIP